ncbi:hypothetical protein D3C76_801850 [compost metagenome]
MTELYLFPPEEEGLKPDAMQGEGAALFSEAMLVFLPPGGGGTRGTYPAGITSLQGVTAPEQTSNFSITSEDANGVGGAIGSGASGPTLFPTFDE